MYSVVFDIEQPANIGVSHSITDPSEHAVDHSYKKKKLSDSDSVILNEVEEHSSISTADVVTLGSPLKPAVKKTDLSKKVKVPVAITSTFNSDHYLMCIGA